MKLTAGALIMASALAMAAPAWAAGEHAGASTTPGVVASEMETIMRGWSAKKAIIGKAVYNDRNEKIGSVGDLIITPEKYASYAIIGAGGFLKMGTHDVAIPFNQLRIEKDRIMLPGATKETLKNMPEFRYVKK